MGLNNHLDHGLGGLHSHDNINKVKDTKLCLLNILIKGE